jgi:anti-sigma factor RsiW
MTHEQTLELLDDYVGGELSPREERDVRRHLMQCDPCRAEEQALRALLDEAAELPAEMAPPRDLWQDIAPRLQARVAPPAAPAERVDEVRTIGPRPVRPLPWWMVAAASIALVATTALTTMKLTDGGAGEQPTTLASQPAQPPAGANPNAALASFQPVEAEYEKAISDLQAVLETKRGQLAPQTVAALEENLRIIDQAIRESREALAADPNSPELARMLSDTYDAKLNVLRRAVSI